MTRHAKIPATPAEFLAATDQPVKYRNKKGVDAVQGEMMRELRKVLRLRFVDHLSYNAIGRALGRNPALIAKWCKDFDVILSNPAAVQAYKAHEADIMDGVRFLCAQGMYDKLSDPEMRKKQDLSRLTYTLGVLYDKARLERGESTANVMTLADLVKKAHEVSAEVEKEEAHIVDVPAVPSGSSDE